MPVLDFKNSYNVIHASVLLQNSYNVMLYSDITYLDFGVSISAFHADLP